MRNGRNFRLSITLFAPLLFALLPEGVHAAAVDSAVVSRTAKIDGISCNT